MSFQDFKDQTTRAVVSKTIDGILSYTNKNRAAGLLKLTDISEKLMRDKFNKKVFDGARAMISDPDSKWMKYVNSLLDEIDPHVVKMHVLNAGYAMGFRQNAITIFRWCIIAPLSPSRVFTPVRFLRSSPALNQQIQLLLNRFALEDESQQLHHILIGQDGRLFQKGLQHSGTSTKPMGSLASGQPFQLVLQSLLLMLGCGQLALRNILFVSQLFQFFAHGQLLLSDNGQNKSDQLFTVDRLWLGHYLIVFCSYGTDSSATI